MISKKRWGVYITLLIITLCFSSGCSCSCQIGGKEIINTSNAPSNTQEEAIKWNNKGLEAKTLEERIKFESALMHELYQQGFDISPHVIPTKNHTAYAKLTAKTENLTGDRYVTICSCLPGEDKYNWID